MGDDTDRLIDVSFDGSVAPPRTPELEQERRVAVFDLLESNRFGLKQGVHVPEGPYQLKISSVGHQLVLGINAPDNGKSVEIPVPMTALTQIVRDYLQICETYFDAVKHLAPSKIEAIDEGRRAIHDEGSRILLDCLENSVDTDMPTVRRLFTVICALAPRDR